MNSSDIKDYLKDKHADQYIGLDDDIGDDFNDWLSNLDVEELLTFSSEYGELMLIKGQTQ